MTNKTYEKVRAWLRRRDRCEADRVPMYQGEGEPDREVWTLPEMPIGKVDHAQYELIHVLRLLATNSILSLTPGYHYSVVPGQTYSKHVSVIQWEPMNREHHCGPDCKACRLSCGCCPALVDNFKATVINIGPKDIVKYHRIMADGTRQITITRVTR